MARRKHLPDGWETIVQRGVAYWQLLDEPQRQQLVELADFIVGSKRWEAATRLRPDRRGGRDHRGRKRRC